MSENEDQYHDTVLNLEAKVKKNVDTVLKIGNSLLGMFMLGPKPMSFYDSKLKHGLGYKRNKRCFEATKSDLCETWKQNELLKDQLLEATLKHEIECCVLLSHECVDSNMKDEIEKFKGTSLKSKRACKNE
ncbi:hypothetical protein Tco_1395068 [Tanacetum coccineum]